MTKLITSFMFFLSFAFSSEITLENTQKRLFEKSVEINSKVIQLPSSKQSLMALLDGKIVKYYVKEGDIVKKGDKIAQALIKNYYTIDNEEMNQTQRSGGFGSTDKVSDN